MRQQPDYSVYLVTDRGLCASGPLDEVVLRAVSGGASIVQLREKDTDTRGFVEFARALKARLSLTGVPLLINDRVDVALACGADGVHVGQSDMLVPDVRGIMGRDAIIGLSVESLTHVAEAEEYGVDYMGVSPVFETPTKTDTSFPWGLEGLRVLRTRTLCPLVAIGGIDEHNAADVFEAGADGVAVVSAICASDDPKSAAAVLRRIAVEHRLQR
ncbi:thiamine phosphate synthase [Oleidesulfovibrio sp.]|uniref:thiamine phosphate synthase n=1 Tax=Oleidesulfovibrio sp. TaxID=2909707 RepID=UPI003A849D8F